MLGVPARGALSPVRCILSLSPRAVEAAAAGGAGADACPAAMLDQGERMAPPAEGAEGAGAGPRDWPRAEAGRGADMMRGVARDESRVEEEVVRRMRGIVVQETLLKRSLG